MNTPTKLETPLTQVFSLIGIASGAFYTVSNGPRFAQFHTVDIVLLISVGMCVGVAFALLVGRLRA
jgi:hypothetical protein